MAKVLLRILCEEDVRRAFKKYAVDYKNYGEALKALLINAGAYVERRLSV